MKPNEGLNRVIEIAREWAKLDPTGNEQMVEALKQMDAESSASAREP